MSRSLDADPNAESGSAVEPLEGFTIGVTAARRREELGAALERRGATVRYAPAIRIIPVADDTELRVATEQCLSEPLDLAIVTTGIGYRGWVEAADSWGLGDELLAALGRTTVLARGPKVRGAIRASGLREAWSPDSESSHEVLRHLLSGGSGELAGKRIAVQLHGEPTPGMTEALREAGAHVIEVGVYRWMPPEDEDPLRRMIEAVVAREVHAVAFTSAPASMNFLRTARELGRGDETVQAMRDDVLAACVGPVTSAPLERVDIPVVIPERFRLGALIREIVVQVPRRFTVQVAVGGRQLQVRGHGVVIDDQFRALAPAGLALLRLLAARPGAVVSRAAMMAALPGANDEHAVEVAIARLRTSLGDPSLIRTVVKRGYRLSASA